MIRDKKEDHFVLGGNCIVLFLTKMFVWILILTSYVILRALHLSLPIFAVDMYLFPFLVSTILLRSNKVLCSQPLQKWHSKISSVQLQPIMLYIITLLHYVIVISKPESRVLLETTLPLKRKFVILRDILKLTEIDFHHYVFLRIQIVKDCNYVSSLF